MTTSDDDVTSGDLKIEHISREQVNVRVFGSTAVLSARDSATWLYHGHQLSGHYKVILIYSKRDGQWQLCAVQACPMVQPGAHVALQIEYRRLLKQVIDERQALAKAAA